MSAGSGIALEERVLVLVPAAADTELCSRLRAEAGLRCEVCADLDTLCRELERGAGMLLLTDDALEAAGLKELSEALVRQPSWSELPVLLLANHDGDAPAAARAMDLLGNVTLLERPVRVTTLVSALRAALRSRRRQYELRDRLEQLREADRRKDEFLATLAHELRNPLAPILNSLELLRAYGTESETAAQVSAIMDRQVQHMVRLVDDLLEISRITLGKVELRPEPIDLAVVIHSAIETCHPQIVARRHAFRVELPDEPLLVEADPTRMSQVLANLLSNAAKYTGDGGELAVVARREGSQAVVAVRDNGIGIAPEMQLTIFDMFAQGRSAVQRAQGGLGIGLTLVRTLVHLHGGTVEVHSEGPGRGSEFVVRVPALEHDARARPDGPSPERARAPANLGRVLVVDDNRDAADSLGLLLRLQGIEVDVAYDGSAALTAIRGQHPQAVFLDIGMPDMDGHEVARRVRQDPELRDVVLIALTGWSQEEDMRRSRAAGFDHHLVKPVIVDSRPLRDLLTSLARRRVGESRN